MEIFGRNANALGIVSVFETIEEYSNLLYFMEKKSLAK